MSADLISCPEAAAELPTSGHYADTPTLGAIPEMVDALKAPMRAAQDIREVVPCSKQAYLMLAGASDPIAKAVVDAKAQDDAIRNGLTEIATAPSHDHEDVRMFYLTCPACNPKSSPQDNSANVDVGRNPAGAPPAVAGGETPLTDALLKRHADETFGRTPQRDDRINLQYTEAIDHARTLETRLATVRRALQDAYSVLDRIADRQNG